MRCKLSLFSVFLKGDTFDDAKSEFIEGVSKWTSIDGRVLRDDILSKRPDRRCLDHHHNHHCGNIQQLSVRPQPMYESVSSHST